MFKRIGLALAMALSAYLPVLAIADISGGITAQGTVNAGDVVVFQNRAQVRRALGTPVSGQCLVYTGTYPSGSWGAGSCVAAGAGTVTSVTLNGTAGDITVTGTCASINVISCTFDLASIITAAGPIGDASHIAQISYDAKGRLTAVSSVAISIPFSSVSGAVACSQLPTFTGDISNTLCATLIANGAVSLAKIANGTALAVIGRSANSSGVYADIQATAASGAVLRESGSAIGFGTVATAGIANNAVTLAKLATQAANTVVANGTSAAAVPTAFAMPSCSAAASALQWLTNTGFQCGTIAVGRTLLTGATNYYVTKTGNDANPCTVGSPCLTIQRGIDMVTKTIDGGGNDVTVNIGAGSYAESLRINNPMVGIRNFTLLGDIVTPANVALTGNGTDTFQMNLPGQYVVVGGITASAGSGANSDVFHVSGGTLQVATGIVFGVAQQNHLDADGTGQISVTATETIIGGAVAHYSASFGGFISAVGTGCNIPSPVFFSAAFAEAADIGKIQAIGQTYTGTANGQKYISVRNSDILTSATINYFPGNVAGTTATGGIYN